ncbi:MAG TPA: type II secretion system F family protein [Streptosporangiaceae bacterium]|jgi:Flp pilus assembly protein TadB
MTPGALIAALAGLLAGTGIACLAAWRFLPAAPVAAPPPRWRVLAARWRITPRLGVTAAVTGIVVLAVTGWPVAALAAVPAVIAVPRILSRRPSRARIARLEALEAWTRRLADVLAASRGLEDAITYSAATAPPPIAGPVAALAAGLQHRAPAQQVLRAFADAIDDPVGDLIATALLLAADRRGPGVHAVLTELAGDVAKDVAGRREIEAERATYRTALAWIVAFLLAYTAYLLLRRSYSAPFGTPAGQLVLAAVAACYAAGLYWLHRLSATFGPRRFLHAHPAVPAGRQPAAPARSPS